ncbi:MAG: hypothetical protein KGH98_01485 [Candidatus Micrarchaeota archaeon]|nr:hypothetical protein [Candidatus Micrarchaeota archaeon]
MEEGTAYLSTSVDGKRRLTHKDSTYLWEPAGSGILETRFNKNGHITDQNLFKKGMFDFERRLSEVATEIGAVKFEEAPFSDVEIDKRCPKCSATALKRYYEQNRNSSDLPIMPIYICASCGTKSYFLTDAYLERLVNSNRQLFSQQEAAELEKDAERFMKELKGYIIRIYASKRIIEIR